LLRYYSDGATETPPTAVGNWDVSNVTSMRGLFYGTLDGTTGVLTPFQEDDRFTNFDQDISGWRSHDGL
jgi:hypothetical protein